MFYSGYAGTHIGDTSFIAGKLPIGNVVPTEASGPALILRYSLLFYITWVIFPQGLLFPHGLLFPQVLILLRLPKSVTNMELQEIWGP